MSKNSPVSERDVMGYAPPQGPTNQMRASVGLGGVNYGNCGTQCSTPTKNHTSGSPGLHGEVMFSGGTQGKR